MRLHPKSVFVVAVLVAGTLAVQAADTRTDPAKKYAWNENVGWVNAGPTNREVTVHFNGDTGWLSGYAWGENIGWIKMGANAGGPYVNTTTNNWGVNMAANGSLSGFAWGENVGWIKCNPANGGVTVNLANGQFSGHAWGENIGWLKWSGSSPDYGVRTLAFDTQPQGTPNWWLDHHGVAENYDEGDSVPAWMEYVMDTDPNDVGSYLRIVAVSNSPAATDVTFWPASTRRYYSLNWRGDLTTGGWTNVAGQTALTGTGGEQTVRDTNTAARAFYRVKATVTP